MPKATAARRREKYSLALCRRIQALHPPAAAAALWWLGQSGFVIKLAGRIIYLDVFFSAMRSRRTPPLVLPRHVTHADVICGTHDHIDHIDHAAWPKLAAASPEALFVVPLLLRRRLIRELGLSGTRLLGVDEHQSIQIGPVTISAIPAAHEFLDRDRKTGLHPWLGYVIQGDGLTIYHAGDTCLYEGLENTIRRFKPDVMLLPISGRDARRLKSGCLGNMTFQEAADLAGHLRPSLVAPMHYDMFTFNGADPRRFTAYLKVKYPRQQSLIFHHGRPVIVQKSKSHSLRVVANKRRQAGA